MAQTLQYARSLCDEHAGARPVQSSDVGRFVIALIRNDWGNYIPTIARLIRLTAKRASVTLHLEGDERRTLSLTAVYWEPSVTRYDNAK